MAMRMTGLMSGMDTESIIQELVAAKQTKVDDAKKAQTKLEWKQTAWKDLNTKLKNLQSKYIANMRFSTAYSKRTTKVSNSSAVSVITGENAVKGVQSLKINQLAKTGYLTGAEIKSEDGKSLTAASKMSDIKGFTDGGTFNITSGSKSVDVTVTADTTISDVLNKLKEAGVNANFDAKNQRFFVSASASGANNDFSITASDANGDAALSALGLKTAVGPDSNKATYEKYAVLAAFYVDGDKQATLDNINADGRITDAVDARVKSYLKQYTSLMDSKTAAETKKAEITDKYSNDTLESVEYYATELSAKQEEKSKLEEELKNMADGDDKTQKQAELDALNEEMQTLSDKKADAVSLAATEKTITDSEAQMKDLTDHYINVTASTDADGKVTYSATATSALQTEVEDSYYNQVAYAAQVVESVQNGTYAAGGATKVDGQDAEIVLNGATFTGNTNVFEINGLTFTALSTTAAGEEITVTTEDDVDGIYDMVKNFLKEYNSLINEMDKLYNADSAKGYEPLTDDEKDAMSDSEVEKYEQKIKDALLRRDSNLSTVSSALKEVMSAGIEVNGKIMYLSNFGINTLGYFEAPDNEKNAYHIDGDADDASTSGNADVLKSMISSDPDTVVSFFSTLSKNLYDKMSSLSKSVDGYRSFGNFYDDKKMKSDYDDYKTKIADLEEKLNDYEDKWYSKFSKMETALAKLQSNSSAVTSLLGGS